MKLVWQLALIFILTFFIYFAVGTNFSFVPKWTLDYFNLLAQSLIHFRLDLVNPGTTYDLVEHDGKWFVAMGPLAALPFIPIQIVMGRFIPSIYVTIFFASINVCLVYLLLLRLKKEFFPKFTRLHIFIVLIFFAFGTTNFYVGTLGSFWHVDQMVSTAIATLGIYVIFKKTRTMRDYIFSSILFSFLLLGRPPFVGLLFLPFLLLFWENRTRLIFFIKQAIPIFGLPLVFFSTLFLLHNYARFGHIFEYGYNHIHEAGELAKVRETYGPVSVNYVPYNLWYMLFEIPSIKLQEGFSFNFNLMGNSIFFLSPPLLAIFLAFPWGRRGKNLQIDPYISALWITAIITMLPSLMIYSTGWMQFGYRYSLDITVLLILLGVFGLKGRINILFFFGTVLAIILYLWGIRLLM